MADYSGDAIPAGASSRRICRSCRSVVRADDSCDCTARAGTIIGHHVPPDGCTCRSQFERTGEHVEDCWLNQPKPAPFPSDAEQILATLLAEKARKEANPGMRIVSDGTPHGTKVFFNGEEIPHVRAVSWRIAYDAMAEVDLELSGVPVVVNAVMPPEVTQVCPQCGDCANHTCDPEAAK